MFVCGGAPQLALGGASESAQSALRKLAVLRAPFDIAAAAAVAGTRPNEAKRLLAELYACGLVEADSAAGRYALHHLVRSFAYSYVPPPVASSNLTSGSKGVGGRLAKPVQACSTLCSSTLPSSSALRGPPPGSIPLHCRQSAAHIEPLRFLHCTQRPGAGVQLDCRPAFPRRCQAQHEGSGAQGSSQTA